jgi:hypothetical protein
VVRFTIRSQASLEMGALLTHSAKRMKAGIDGQVSMGSLRNAGSVKSIQKTGPGRKGDRGKEEEFLSNFMQPLSNNIQRCTA